MSSEPISAAEVEQYRAAVGRSVLQEDMVERRMAQLFAATLDVPVPEKDLPPLWHYGLFLSLAPTSALDADGHPRRGDFLPPIRLPRRMFAGSSLKFHRPLTVGEMASRTARIASVDHRHGKTGDLVFVRVAYAISQQGVLCFEEEQTIVYRPAGAVTPAVVDKPRAPLAAGEIEEIWQPTTTELFRYSAVTFNGHRIHYDLPYATGTEGYPGLVVHGPLTATRLCAFAGKVAEAGLKTFAFRGEAPVFAGQEIRLVCAREDDTIKVRAERADGVTAMSAVAEVASA